MKKAKKAPALRQWQKLEFSQNTRLSLVIALSLLTGLGLTLVGILIATQSLHATLGWITAKLLYIFAGTLFLALIVLFLTCVTRSLFAGALLVSAAAVFISFANYFKNLIASTPLQITDFGQIGKLMEITDLNSASITFSRNSILAVIATLLMLAVILAFSGKLRLPLKRRLITVAVSVLVFSTMFIVRPTANAWCFEPLGAGLYASYGQAYSDDKCGVPLGLLRSAVCMNSGYKLSESDKGPVLQDAQGYINNIEGNGNDVQPNVIVILSESFFDVTKLPGVTYENDPLADFHKACASGVSGKFYSRTLGYGTCNIELEVLTGINNRFLPSDEMLCYWSGDKFDTLSTVPRIFQQNGYYTAFLHTFNDEIYNRTPIYTHLGFDDLYFSEDFAAIDPAAAAAEDYWAYMSGKISGEFYSDDYMADLLIDLYEQKTASGPVFLYGATMENHTPFAADKYDSYDYPVDSGLSGDAESVLNTVTQGAANSSRALGKLIKYFSASDEPTIIIFFGDHRPGLPLSDGTTVYSALGMCDPSNSNWSAGELAELYATDYVIWANDDSLLPADAGSTQDTSGTFLGLSALRLGGMALDPYWRMIASINESCTAYTWQYYVSESGGVYDSLPADLSDRDARKFEVMSYLMQEAFSADGGRAAFYELK